MNRQRRHKQRPRFATIAVTSAAAYGVYKLGLWAWSRWIADDHEASEQESAKGEPINNFKEKIDQRRLHILRRNRKMRCREESLFLMKSFAVVLQHSLEESTDTAQARRLLKLSRKNITKGPRDVIDSAQEDALWLKIQESTVTRMVAGAFLQAILVTVVTVQVHLLGGYTFRKTMEPKSLSTDYDDNAGCSGVSTSTSYIHQIVLERTYHRFVDHCVSSVLEAVRSAVLHCMYNSDWDMKDPSSALHMTHKVFLNTMNRIRTAVEDSCSHHHTLLQKFFLPPALANHAVEGNVDDDLTEVDNILNETWDMLDSPVVSRALADCVNHVFAKMDEQVWVPLFADETDRPIASIIAQLRSSADDVFEKDCCNSALMADLATMVEVADLSFN